MVVRIRKVSWEEKENLKYSCNTDSRLADFNTPGCSHAGMAATEVTVKEGVCVCTCVTIVVWSTFGPIQLL